jgi:tight adherence protein C
MAILICAGLFVVILFAVFGIGYVNFVKPARTYYRLNTVANSSGQELNDSGSESFFGYVLGMVGKLLPNSPGELALSKKELSAAGFRSDAAPSIMVGSRLVLCAALLIAGLMSRNRITNTPILRLMIPVGGAVVGYMLPGLVLDRLTAKRREAIRLGLPDALDMLVVCSEVGCALDQAIQYVSREFKTVHPALSDELVLLNAQLLAGATRAAALRSFADRTGEEEVKKLVAILIQTDRFGTSIAESLRTQSDFMRIRRRQIAEEKAGKVGVKLVFPIFFFCMPSLVIVVAGPAMLQLLNHFAKS